VIRPVGSAFAFFSLLFLQNLSASSYDWRFADPNSTLIAGSTLSPTSTDPVPTILYHSFTPIGMVPSAFQASLAKTASITYSLVTAKDDIVVMTGVYNYASLRSAGGSIGMTSQTYRGIEVLSTTTPSRVQVALISPSTLVIASQTVTRAAIDRYLLNPSQSQSNLLIQQSSTYASGWDFFALSSGMSVSKALAFLYGKGNLYLATKAQALSAALANSTGFQARGRVQNLQMELTINEGSPSDAQTAAAGIQAIPAAIKASGPGVASLISALATGTNVVANGSTVSVTINPSLYTLTTQVSPAGAGTISPSTSGIPFAYNTVVSLTATPAACYGAATWSGNAPGGTVTMTSDQVVTATFPASGIAATASSVTVTPGGVRLNKTTGRYQQSIAITNSGSTLSNASLIFDNLSAGAAVYSPAGTTVCAPAGSPYIDLGTLNVGLRTVVVDFTVTNPSQTIQYTTRVLAGAGSR
jgi:hypothetical protein